MNSKARTEPTHNTFIAIVCCRQKPKYSFTVLFQQDYNEKMDFYLATLILYSLVHDRLYSSVSIIVIYEGVRVT